ncbi:ATPase [Gammaproteobacteria bacterium 45_16_T64]|nr:ATPase [Gammaproteobacteria bacterium 45_16_T64]
MSFSLTQIFLIGISYLSFVFLVAYFTEQGYLPAKFVRHPAVYVLSLGVFASAWAIYGAVGFASRFGFNFIAYYLGISAAFMLGPILLAPILKLIKNYQLGSLADLLAFRYRSPWVGALVTLCMLIGIMPLLALQIQAVADTIHILNQETSPNTLAFIFCCVIILFAILFGARHISTRDKHEGLVIAIAFESLIKIIGMVSIGIFVLFNVFDGPTGLQQWLTDNPYATETLYAPLKEGPWRSIVAAFFFSAVVTPHMFHMAFTENLNPRALLTASWGLPLYLFILALPIPIILWSSTIVQPDVAAEYVTLGVPMALNSPTFSLIAFVTGLSASSGVIIVCTLALSAMCLNHLVLPLSPVNTQNNLYSWLLWTRRALIAFIILASYIIYRVMAGRHSLSELGFLTFVATMQFVPGLFGVLFWPKANRYGFITGLLSGISVWVFLLLLPILFDYQVTINIPLLIHDTFPQGDNSYLAATVAIFVNCMVFATISVFTNASTSENLAAETCNVDNLRRSYRWELSVSNSREFIERLTKPLGATTARREVELALHDLAMSLDETRPYSLRRLRDQLETNLSGLLGPSVAHEIIDEALPYVMHSDESAVQDIHHTESRLEEYHHKLTGLAAELDNLRRFHRQTLQDLPMGVCSLGLDGEVFGWNHSMVKITNIPVGDIVGSSLDHLPEPWRSLLQQLSVGPETHEYKKEVESQGVTRWLNLHKASIRAENQTKSHGGLVIVVEDLTETRMLEHKLAHNERLASVGRLAAGVAHEIGNPITGIACLAQNLQYESDNPDIVEMSNEIVEQTKRVTRIVQSLVNFSHSGTNKVIQAPVSLRECAQEAFDLLKLSGDEKTENFTNDIDADHIISGDRQRITQIFINLLSNARDASSIDSPIVTRSVTRNHTVTLEVEDRGCGIPENIKESIYEPFVTSKDPGKGTGLGMAVVYSIIEEHFGHISIDSPISTDYKGTRVTITLPRYRENDEISPSNNNGEESNTL